MRRDGCRATRAVCRWQKRHDDGAHRLRTCDEQSASDNNVSSPHGGVDDIDQLLAEYSDLVEGIGEFPGEHSLTLRPDANPVVHAPPTTPVALRDKVKKELSRMEANNIIVKVTEPTDWVSSMVVVQKRNGDIRVCLDPRDLNMAIKRQYYHVPTLESVTSTLTGAKPFSLLDARSGYWQIKLTESTSRSTTFNTPYGRYRYLRMPFRNQCSSRHLSTPC